MIGTPEPLGCPAIRRVGAPLAIGTSVLAGGAAVEVIGGAEFIKAEGCEVLRQSDPSRLGPIHVTPEVRLSNTCVRSSIDDL